MSYKARAASSPDHFGLVPTEIKSELMSCHKRLKQASPQRRRRYHVLTDLSILSIHFQPWIRLTCAVSRALSPASEFETSHNQSPQGVEYAGGTNDHCQTCNNRTLVKKGVNTLILRNFTCPCSSISVFRSHRAPEPCQRGARSNDECFFDVQPFEPCDTPFMTMRSVENFAIVLRISPFSTSTRYQCCRHRFIPCPCHDASRVLPG